MANFIVLNANELNKVNGGMIFISNVRDILFPNPGPIYNPKNRTTFPY
ncbi:bacteriocin [Ruminococcus sp.]|jgi:bacteriocin-like protein|nr:bacteriocin [Ruminococcus sp.]